MPEIKLKRAYDTAAKKDGMRILVDRLWPRGVAKADAQIDEWLKKIGPSNELRKSYHDGDVSYEAFSEKYKKELSEGIQKEAYETLEDIAQERDRAITLVYSAKNDNNNASVLKEMLQSQ